MSRRHSPCFVRRALAGASALVIAASAAPAQADTIVWKGNQKPRSNVKVVRENVKVVVFLPKTRGAKEQNAKASRVRAVLYDDAPEAFRVAGQEFASKKWGAAAAQYEKSLRAAGVRPWIKIYANFHLAECYRHMGGGDPSHYDTAIQHYQSVLAAQSDNRLLPETLYGVAIALREKKEYPQATAMLNKLSQAVSTHGLDARWDFTAQLEAARLLEEQGHFGEAGAKYRALKGRASGKFGDIANLATMREGLCLVKGGKYADARSHFKALLNSAKDDQWEVRAGARLGLGLCYYQEENFQRARYEFLRVNALYGNTEAHAQATFWAGRANLQRGAKSKEKGVKRMATEHFKQVLVLHPETEWADKAERELIKLGAKRELLARLRKK